MVQYSNFINNNDIKEEIDSIMSEKNKFYDVEQSNIISNKKKIIIKNNINNSNYKDNALDKCLYIDRHDIILNYFYIFIISLLFIISFINRDIKYVLYIIIITLFYIFIKYIINII